MKLHKSHFLVLAVCTTLLGACIQPIGRVYPQPTTVLPKGSYALVLNAEVRNEQSVDRLRVTDLRKSLSLGFHNALRGQATADPSMKPTVLHIEQFVLRRIPGTDRLEARVRGRWVSSSREDIGTFAGRVSNSYQVARVMNRFAADRHEELTGIIEISFEKIFATYRDSIKERDADLKASSSKDTASDESDEDEGGFR